MRKWLLSFYVLMFLGSLVYAQSTASITSSSNQTQLKSNVGGVSFGYLRVGTTEVISASWHPDLKYGLFSLGLDVNYALGPNQPAGYENVVLRYIGYGDDQKGLRYGIVDSLTWGHGLLIDGYSTRLTGAVLLNNEQLAWLGYYRFLPEPYLIKGLATRTGLNAVRMEEKINPLLTLGQTYVADSNGVTIPGTGANQKVSGLGIDVTLPLPANFEGYTEYAQLFEAGHGGGLTAGISWAQDIMVAAANFNVGYRFLDSKFVPGYFNAAYETNPINLVSYEADTNSKNGYLAQLGIDALGLAKLNARYENYNESGSAVRADTYVKLPQDVEVTGYYQQPKFVNFRSLDLNQGAIIGGSLACPINPFTKTVVHYKKYYDSGSGQIVSTKYVEIEFNF